MKNKFKCVQKRSETEIRNYKQFFELFKRCPLPEEELLHNLGLFIDRPALSRILFMWELYKKIINVHGIVIEFGVRWGQNLALFESFRGIEEPFNYNRKIIGFDTFEGFPGVVKGKDQKLKKGDYGISKDYYQYLEKILEYHEFRSPISHIKKYEIII